MVQAEVLEGHYHTDNKWNSLHMMFSSLAIDVMVLTQTSIHRAGTESHLAGSADAFTPRHSVSLMIKGTCSLDNCGARDTYCGY